MSQEYKKEIAEMKKEHEEVSQKLEKKVRAALLRFVCVIHVRRCVCTCTCVYISACLFVCVHICVNVHALVCGHVSMCTPRTCVSACVQTCGALFETSEHPAHHT
jgi:hypothetical protein